MTIHRFFAPMFAAAFAAVTFSACVTWQGQPKPAAPTPPPTPKPVGIWKGDGVQGAPSIVVDLSEQRAYFYKGEELVGDSKCSSGKSGFRTPPGEYKLTQKNKHHRSNLYGVISDAVGATVNRDADMSKTKLEEGQTFAGAKMPFYMRFHGGYGLHSGRVPNYPASHGCVRLPYFMASHFFEHAVIGMPVTVRE